MPKTNERGPEPTATIPLEEYGELIEAKEEPAGKNERIRKPLAPFADAKAPPEAFEKTENGEFANPRDPLDRTTLVTLVCKIKSNGHPR